MSDSPSLTRRRFVTSAGAACIGGCLASGTGATTTWANTLQSPAVPQEESRARQLKAEPAIPAARYLKTLKIGMVQDGDSLVEKFAIARDAGFDGIELNSPDVGWEPSAVREATAETGLPVDGTVCSTHWAIRHSDPDPAVRQQALDDLETALRDTHAVGGHTALLVVGNGSDGPEAEIWPRAIENIAKAIPLAARLGVVIAIENVWNRFLYDHDGDATQSADKFVRFVDELNSPWVGMQFDIGNHWKYGSMGDWIRQLDKRIVKLDVKGFSRAENKFTAIGEGDIDFADVRKALDEINYHGWIAAEVGGGDAAYLANVARQMDTAFGITK